ncbi:MAG: right-handed parallel beta-helix repeat-containing protein [Myxococcota bacterium]
MSPCASIGFAVLQAAAGDEIWFAGEFIEAVNVPKSVSILGKSVEVSPTPWANCSGQFITGACPIVRPPSGSDGFLINPGAAGSVTLSGVNVLNPDNASAVNVQSGELSLSRCNLNGRSGTPGIGVGGGGLFSGFATTARVSDCNFANNQATSGGAIRSSGDLEVVSSFFSNNTATFTGGAIEADGPRVVIRDSTFEFNQSEDFGGALRLSPFQDPAIVASSTFNSNRSDRLGGAIAFFFTSFKLSGSTFNGNTLDVGPTNARTGGAVYIAGSTGSITNTDFVNNLIIAPSGFERRGGGVAIESFSNVSIGQSTFISNQLTPESFGRQGGGLYIDESTVNLYQSEIRDNDHSGVYTRNATFTMSDTTIDGHQYGINDVSEPGSTVEITRSTISSNSDVGIFSLGESHFEVSNATIDSLDIAIASRQGGVVDIRSSTIVAPHDFGSSALLAFSGSLVGATDSIISGACSTQTNGSVNVPGSNRWDHSSCGFDEIENLDLGGLLPNGGLVMTRLPGAMTDAVDQGGQGCLSAPVSGFDGRGALRDDGACDIGAVELPEPGFGLALAIGISGLLTLSRGRQSRVPT